MTSPPKTTKKQLTPFGGIQARAEWDKLKAEALATRSRQECFDLGYLTVKDLDDEELRFGRCRDSSGRIPVTKRKTELIPIDQYDAMVQEHELRFKQKLRQNLDDMLDIMVDIAKDDTVEPRDRFEAAKYIFERTAGKTPDTVNVNVKHAPYEELLNSVTGIAPISRAQHREVSAADPRGAGIIDAEFEEVPQDTNENATTAPESQAGEARKPETPPSEPTEPEPYTQPDGPRAEDLEDGTENAWLGGLPEPVLDQVEAEMYMNEGDITTYGRRADEKRSYLQQQRDAEAIRTRRKEAKKKIQDAKKSRKVARALGNDELETEITGMNLGDDGKLRFETQD